MKLFTLVDVISGFLAVCSGTPPAIALTPLIIPFVFGPTWRWLQNWLFPEPTHPYLV